MFNNPVWRLWPIPVVVVVGAIVLFLFATYSLVIRPRLHLKSIPGPWWAPYSRLWLFKTLASEDSPNRYIEVNDKYGTSDSLKFVQQCPTPRYCFSSMFLELFTSRSSVAYRSEPFAHQ